jgi:hypothetical protein
MGVAGLRHFNPPSQDRDFVTPVDAAYLKYSYSTVRDKIRPLPSFPKPIRIRTANGTGLPLCKAREVIQWAESLQGRS